MAVASKHFQAQLDGGKDELVVKGVYGLMLKMIIEYCYTGRIAIYEENVNFIIAIASNLELIELEQRCREFWEINLSGNNAVTNLLNAEKYNLKDLRQKAIKRIRADFEEIPVDELLQIDAPNFQEILSSGDFGVNEAVIVDRLVQWVNKNEIDRAKLATNLVKKIRLEHIPAEACDFSNGL